MPTIRAYQFELREKSAQGKSLRLWSGALRWLWNKAIGEQQRRHKAGEKFANYVEMAKWLKAWRDAPESAWLCEGPFHPQQQVLRRLEEAYKRFFAKAGGYPKFKRYGDDPGIRFPDPKQFFLDQQAVGAREDLADQSHLDQNDRLAAWCANGRIKLPKLGWVRLRQSELISGELKNVSIRRNGGKWICSIQVETASTESAGLAPTLGIDVGINLFAATSDGDKIEGLKALSCSERRLRRYQKSVSRKVKGSCNRKKAIQKLGNLHRKIANKRKDWISKLSTELADRHCVIALEDLKIKNMSASAAGSVEEPGRNVKQKAGLNKSILDAAWGDFRRQLEYKTQWRGGQVVRVNPAYTSQRCSSCGHTAKENRKAQEVFACVACGQTENADVNAAKNILAAGIAVWTEQSQSEACGEDVRRGASAKKKRAASVKQEPTEEKVYA